MTVSSMLQFMSVVMVSVSVTFELVSLFIVEIEYYGFYKKSSLY